MNLNGSDIIPDDLLDALFEACAEFSKKHEEMGIKNSEINRVVLISLSTVLLATIKICTNKGKRSKTLDMLIEGVKNNPMWED